MAAWLQLLLLVAALAVSAGLAARLVVAVRLRNVARRYSGSSPQSGRYDPTIDAVVFPAAGASHSGTAVLVHGWSLYDPAFYSHFIETLRRRGFEVVFPFYQHSYFIGGMIRRLGDQLRIIARRYGEPALLAGHSGGAAAALAAAMALPASVCGRNLLLLAPGDGSGPNGEAPFPMFRLRWQVPVEPSEAANTVVRVVTAEDDEVVGSWTAERIMAHLRDDPRRFTVRRRQLAAGPEPLGHLFPLAGTEPQSLPPLLRRTLGRHLSIPPASAQQMLDVLVAEAVPLSRKAPDLTLA